MAPADEQQSVGGQILTEEERLKMLELPQPDAFGLYYVCNVVESGRYRMVIPSH